MGSLRVLRLPPTAPKTCTSRPMTARIIPMYPTTTTILSASLPSTEESSPSCIFLYNKVLSERMETNDYLLSRCSERRTSLVPYICTIPVTLLFPFFLAGYSLMFPIWLLIYQINRFIKSVTFACRKYWIYFYISVNLIPCFLVMQISQSKLLLGTF